MRDASQSGAISRKLIIGMSIPVLLAGLVFGWVSLTRYKLEHERANWKTTTLERLAGLSITNNNVVQQLEPYGLRNSGDQPAWIGENVLLMKNQEYLIFAFHHGMNNGFVDHLFLARGSNGHWYYSTYHFCNEMAGVIADDPPGSIAEFAARYAVREFDGKSDVCLEHTWPVKK